MRPRIAVLALLLAPAALSAQRVNLNVTGFPIAFPTPTGADFAAGYIESSTVTTFTVDAQTGPPSLLRTVTVSVRCRTPCPATGSKAAGTLQWRRADQATWHTLTTANSPIESRPMQRNTLNDPWSNSIVWRFLLDWQTDAPGPASRFDIVFTLTVTSP